MRHEDATPTRRFERLSRLRDFEVARHEIDPRGWTIVNAENRAIGEVRDLIVDTERMAAHFLDVEVEAKLFHIREEDARLLVPMDRAHRVDEHRRLRIDGITRESLAAMALAREDRYLDFWEEWWSGTASRTRAASTVVNDRPHTTPSDLRRALEDVPPGETVRIPIVHEELVVERRPLHADEHVVARDRDVAPPRRDDEVR